MEKTKINIVFKYHVGEEKMSKIYFFDNSLESCEKMSSCFKNKMTLINKKNDFNSVHIPKDNNENENSYQERIVKKIDDIINDEKSNMIFLIDMDLPEDKVRNIVSLNAVNEIIERHNYNDLCDKNIYFVFVTDKMACRQYFLREETYKKEYYHLVGKPNEHSKAGYKKAYCLRPNECPKFNEITDVCEYMCLEQLLLEILS